KNGSLPLLASPPPMPAPTMVPAALPSPPTARLFRTVTRSRVRLAGVPDVFRAAAQMPPPVAVPTNWQVPPLPPSPPPPLPPLSAARRVAYWAGLCVGPPSAVVGAARVWGAVSARAGVAGVVGPAEGQVPADGRSGQEEDAVVAVGDAPAPGRADEEAPAGDVG